MIKIYHGKRFVISGLIILISIGIFIIFFPHFTKTSLPGVLSQQNTHNLSLIEFITLASNTTPKEVTISAEFQGSGQGHFLGYATGSIFTGNYILQSNHHMGFQPFQENSHIQNDIVFSVSNTDNNDFSLIYNNHFDTVTVDNPNPQTPNRSYIYLNQQDLVQLINPQDTFQLRYGLLNRYKNVRIQDLQGHASLYTILQSISGTIRQLELQGNTTHIELHSQYFSLIGDYYPEDEHFEGEVSLSGTTIHGRVSSSDNTNYTFILEHDTTIPGKTTGTMTINRSSTFNSKTSLSIDATTRWQGGVTLDSSLFLEINPKKTYQYKEIPEESLNLQTIYSQLFGE